jgi:hypothetical protein
MRDISGSLVFPNCYRITENLKAILIAISNDAVHDKMTIILPVPKAPNAKANL